MRTSARRTARSTPVIALGLLLGLVEGGGGAALARPCGGVASVVRYTSMPVAEITVGLGLLDMSVTRTVFAVQMRCRLSE
jgi:hypothetical protein